jgi:hypothetical protein
MGKSLPALMGKKSLAAPMRKGPAALVKTASHLLTRKAQLHLMRRSPVAPDVEEPRSPR